MINLSYLVKQRLMKPEQNIDLRVKQMKQGNKSTFKVTQETKVRIQDSQL